MVVSVGSRGTLTLPSNIRKKLDIRDGDYFELSISKGKIVITPVLIIPKIKLTEKGKVKEREASEQIRDKKYKTFKTAEELIEDLNED